MTDARPPAAVECAEREGGERGRVVG